jgi:hypothetical protein
MSRYTILHARLLVLIKILDPVAIVYQFIGRCFVFFF